MNTPHIVSLTALAASLLIVVLTITQASGLSNSDALLLADTICPEGAATNCSDFTAMRADIAR